MRNSLKLLLLMLAVVASGAFTSCVSSGYAVVGPPRPPVVVRPAPVVVVRPAPAVMVAPRPYYRPRTIYYAPRPRPYYGPRYHGRRW